MMDGVFRNTAHGLSIHNGGAFQYLKFDKDPWVEFTLREEDVHADSEWEAGFDSAFFRRKNCVMLLVFRRDGVETELNVSSDLDFARILPKYLRRSSKLEAMHMIVRCKDGEASFFVNDRELARLSVGVVQPLVRFSADRATIVVSDASAGGKNFLWNM